MTKVLYTNNKILLIGGNSIVPLSEKVDITGTGLFITRSVFDASKDWRVLPNNTLWQSTIEIPNGFVYNEVTSPTGRIWMDRNLGASQVAISSTDSASYGDLYQWGRATDGHEKRDSNTTDILNDGSADAPIDNTSEWRVPTIFEWQKEIATWSTQDAAGAFESVLKLPMGGSRYFEDGSIVSLGVQGNYWSSSVTDDDSSFTLDFDSDSVNADIFVGKPKSSGNAIRLIKEDLTLHPRWNYRVGNEGLDTFGFNALPAGTRGNIYVGLGNNFYAVCRDEYNATMNRSLLSFKYNKISRSEGYIYKYVGSSVRLVRNYTVEDGDKIDGRILLNVFSDYDGNTYDGVIIGNQVWSTSNLKTTHYADGTPIPTGYSNSEWINLTTGAYSVYDYTLYEADGIDSEDEMIAHYGLLYNWYAASDSRGLSNNGHVPLFSETEELINYLSNNYNETETTFPDGSSATDINSTNIGKHLKSIRTASA